VAVTVARVEAVISKEMVMCTEAIVVLVAAVEMAQHRKRQ
jgi:hypothetical protein